jgi:hypothetical protein
MTVTRTSPSTSPVLSVTPASADAPDPAWNQAEQLIIDRVTGLSRWDAERWAAAHERQLSRISLTAMRVSYLRVARSGGAGDYLGAAFDRIGQAVSQTSWAQVSTLGGEQGEVMDEIVLAVTEVAQHALATVVLSPASLPS